MGATHKNSADPMKSNTLGWNSNTKKHGGQKRQVRCFLLDRGYDDDLQLMTLAIRNFSKSVSLPALSCKDIVEKYWSEFKNYIDSPEFASRT